MPPSPPPPPRPRPPPPLHALLVLLLQLVLLAATAIVSVDAAGKPAVPTITAIDAPAVALAGRKTTLTLRLAWPAQGLAPAVAITPSTTNVTVNGNATLVAEIPYAVHTNSPTGPLTIAQGLFSPTDADAPTQLATRVALPPFLVKSTGILRLSVTLGGDESPEAASPVAKIHVIPGWLTLLSVVILIALALITKQVLTALFAGVFVSATIIHDYNPLSGFLRAADEYMVRAVADPEHVKVLLFTWWLAGLIALVQRSGGAEGLARAVTRFATDRWKALWCGYGIGALIFFDDFASVLITGSNMIAITDLMHVSREKLAFLVHATSSPPASIAPISSWIGYEVGLIAVELKKLNSPLDAFMVFLRTIPSRFYPIYMLAFLAWLIILKRDFGPMLTAERRACHEGRVSPVSVGEGGEGVDEEMIKPVPGKPRRWLNAAIPILLNVILIILGIFVTGYYATLKLIADGKPIQLDIATIAGNGDSYGSLIYASLFASIVAMIMYKLQRILDVSDSLLNWTRGIKEVVEPVLILILAWAMGAAMNDLQTAEFIVSGLGSALDARTLPTLVFLCSCIISFVTGTSWGTMAVLFPLSIPLANALQPGADHLVVEVTASILTGAIFGDQCSPISGTSVMSALASRCPLAEHVKTQLPYAVAVAIAAILFGYLPVGFGIYPAWAANLIGVLLVGGIVWLIGSRVEDDDDGGILTRLSSFLPRRYRRQPNPRVRKRTTSFLPMAEVLNEKTALVD